MDLPSFFRRKAPAAPAARAGRSDDAAPVLEARTRARRRLIGAVILLGVGVIAFPLLFETEPRPIPVDLPIEIPNKSAAPPLAVPTPAPKAEPAPAEAPPQAPKPAPVAEPVKPPPAAAATPAPVPTPPPAAKAETREAEEGARAKALLEGKTAVKADTAPATAGRYVVQIGAFAEERTVRDVRAKAEGLGLKTYTQVVKVAAGDRTRVRVGPFGERDEAEAVAAKLKKAGLPASVLTL